MMRIARAWWAAGWLLGVAQGSFAAAQIPAQSVTFEPAVLTVGGRKVGIVNMRADAMRRRVAEIWSESSRWSFDARSRTVAERLTSVHESSETWWRRLVSARIGDVTVVAVKGVSGSTAPRLPDTARVADGTSPRECVYVITADKKAASEFGLSPSALAKHLIAAIQNGMEPQRVGRRSGARVTAAEAKAAKHEAAIRSKQAGDEAWNDGDLVGAADRYREALGLSPTYVAARLALALALAATGDRVSAKAEARRVLSDPSATAEQRKAASGILAGTRR